MILALLTAPYLSNKLRTASSVALKSRLPTKMFFTHASRQFESGLIGEKQKRYDGAVAQETRSRTRGSYQTRFNYSTVAACGQTLLRTLCALEHVSIRTKRKFSVTHLSD